MQTTESHYTLHQVDQGEQNRVLGTVSHIDHDRGIVSLRTANSDLRLHFPPAAIAELKRGDKIDAQISVWRGNPAIAGDAPDPSSSFAERQNFASITDIDAGKGIVEVATANGPLRLQLSPATTQSLAVGDRITVEMAFHETDSARKVQ
ncbi:MAG TPA: hypothetical protein VEB21_05440 [Terriglobales bacterium]|nr:hypothetical protein [Terriglobales bacterium]